MALRPYQKRGVAFGYQNPAHFQMVDMGLGKTLTVLNLCQLVKMPTIVFAPLRVALMTWPDEIMKWTPNLSFTVLHGKDKDRNVKLERDIYIVNYDGLKWFYMECLKQNFRLRKCRFVFDESSMIKSPSTTRFKLIEKMRPLFGRHRINLSATPAPNGLHELWSQYKVLDDGKRLGAHYTPFRDKYFQFYPPPRNKTIPLRGTKEALYEKVQDITFRLDAKDYLELPPLTINNVTIDLPPSLRAQYNRLKADSLLEFSETVKATAFNDASLVNKCRQYLQGAVYLDNDPTVKVKRYKVLHDIKMQVLKEICELNAGKCILAPFQFRFELDIARKVFGYNIPTVSGGVGPKESVAILHAWNRGDIPLLMCHPGSISHGLNLQAMGHTLVWCGLPWSLEQYMQTIGRLHRQGQVQAVTSHNIVFRNTADERVASVLAMKDATQQDLLDALRKEFLDDFIRRR